MGEARQSRVVDPAEFAIKIGCLHVQLRHGRDDVWIFMGPVEPRASQQLRTTIVDAGGNALAVQLYVVQPLRPRRWLLDELGELRRDELRKGSVFAQGAGLARV